MKRSITNSVTNCLAKLPHESSTYSRILAVVLMFCLSQSVFSNVNEQTRKVPSDGKPRLQYWQGTLDVGTAQLTLNIEIWQEKGKDSASVYSVEQGNAKLPVDEVSVSDTKISLKLNALNANFKGVLDESKKVCSGTFTQHGHAFELQLKRVQSFDDDAEKLVEFWKGTLDFSGTKLEMGLKIFRMADGSLTAKFSSYSQGATDLAVDFEKEGDTYTMKLPAANLTFTGNLNKVNDKLVGTITQGRRKNELVFTKANFGDVPAKLIRPQTPNAPFPYEAEEVSYENSKQEAKLAGTLTIPSGDGPFPVAITISGSGASDRDATHFDHKPFLVIADHLARRGVAVLRFDDRGRGESTGKHSGATSADFATDVEAGIEFLRKHPKIDADKIGLIGHSEGGLIAPMVAEQRDDVHFIVLLAGTGVDGGVILKSQSTAMMEADGEPEEKLDANRKVHDAILAVVDTNPDATSEEIVDASAVFLDSIDDEATRRLMEPSAKQLLAILGSKWVRYFVNHDPAKTLSKVKCHLLAMNGEKDLQVLCDLNLNPIEKALKEGTPASFKIVRLANTNHMFQETDGSGSPSDYGVIEQTISPKTLNVIGNWIKKVTE